MSTRAAKTSRKQVRRALKKARNLIRDVGFHQGTYAAYPDGVVWANIAHGEAEPVAYCSLGAIHAAVSGTPHPSRIPDVVAPDDRSDVYELNNQAINALSHAVPSGYGISYYNDHHTREEVLGVFELAINNLKEEQK